MPIHLFATWWNSLEVGQQIFLSIAIVSSTLWVILLILNTLGYDSTPDHKKDSRKTLATYLILTFFTLLGWVGSLLYALLTEDILQIILYSSAAGIAGVAFHRWLYPDIGARYKKKTPDSMLASTGKVTRPIPPHRNGFGKIHLNIDRNRIQMEAITAGQELPRGAKVKVIEVLDDKVVLVESLQRDRNSRERFKNTSVRSEPGDDRPALPPDR